MKMIDLDPNYATGEDGARFLYFLCPICKGNYIGLQIAGNGKELWNVIGSGFDDISLIPSVAQMPYCNEEYRKEQFIMNNRLSYIAIRADNKENWANRHLCNYHFYVRNGEILSVESILRNDT